MPCYFVFGCSNNALKKEGAFPSYGLPKVFIYRFPNKDTNPDQLQNWNDLLARKSNPTMHSRVCYNHFLKSDFMRYHETQSVILPSQSILP